MIQNLEKCFLRMGIPYSVYSNYLCGDSLQDILSSMCALLNKVIDNVNEYNKIVDALKNWIEEEGLQIAVDKKLEEMVDDGTFDTIINQKIFADLSGDVENLKPRVLKNENDILDLSNRIEVIAHELNPKNFNGNDITSELQRVINLVKTNEPTEGVPDKTVLGEIKLPSGKYTISETINIPTNIKITGNGKNITVLVSNIDNGTPVFKVTTEGIQSFHNNLESFTIHGNNKNCVGIEFRNVSRWTMKDVMVNETLGEGIKLWESYLGEMYSVLIRGCGDPARYSLLLDGRDMNNGTHALTMVGGEVAGHPTKRIIGGINVEKGTSNTFNGVTVEAFKFGCGISDSGIANTVIGCYFEGNNCNLYVNSESLLYTGNFMAIMGENADRVISVGNASSFNCHNNAFKMNPARIQHVKKDRSNSSLVIASFKDNIVQGYTMKIEDGLFSNTNSTLQEFDGNVNTRYLGKLKYEDDIKFTKKIQLSGAGNIEQLSNGDIQILGATRFIMQKPILTTTLNFTATPSANVIANTIFVDTDGKLKFKDQFNSVKTISFDQ